MDIFEVKNFRYLIVPVAVILIALFFLFGPVKLSGNALLEGGPYYVSLSGNDLGTGTAESPWKTIQYAADSVGPGDEVIVKAGDYRDQGRIKLKVSGEDNNLIKFQAEGEVKTRGFTAFDDYQWKTTNYVSIKGFEIEADGQDLMTGTGIIVGGSGCIIEDNVVKNSQMQGIYIIADTYPASGNLIKDNIVEYSGRSVSEDGIGILIYGAENKNNNIIGNIVRYNSHEGISVYEGSNNIISNNEVYGNDAAGIHIGMDSASGNIIEENEVYENSQRIDDTFGIDLLRVGVNNIVRYNLVHEQYDTYHDLNKQAILNPGNYNDDRHGTGGIRLDGGDWVGHTKMSSLGNKVYYNVVYGEFNGLQIFNFENTEWYNNVVYGSYVYGLSLTGFALGQPNVIIGNTVKNNIFHNTGGSFVKTIHSTGNSIDNNLYFGNALFSYYEGVKDFGEWKTDSGYDSNSLNEDPLFVNAAGKDFSLSSGSFAIDKGVGVGLTRDYDGNSVPKNLIVDIGAHEALEKTIPQANCGDGKIDVGEECDLTNFNGKTCVTQGFNSGSLKCGQDCKLDSSSCVKIECGNGLIETGEECDLTNFNGKTCVTQGFNSGSLKCGQDCKLDSSSCVNSCASKVEICDGVDNNCNGQVDENAADSCSVLGNDYSCTSGKCCITTGSWFWKKTTCTDISDYYNDPEPPITQTQCGNGIIETGEECDLTNFGEKTCISQGFNGGTLACGQDCKLDSSLCATAICGNGIIETGEECDLTNLGGKSCVIQGFDNGDLECGQNCELDSSLCTTEECGNGIIETGENCDLTNLGEKTCLTQGFDSGDLKCDQDCKLDSSLCVNDCKNEVEICDGVDNNCNGQVDENAAASCSVLGSGYSCTSGKCCITTGFWFWKKTTCKVLAN